MASTTTAGRLLSRRLSRRFSLRLSLRPAAQRLADAALAVVLLAATLVLLSHGGADGWRSGTPDGAVRSAADLDLVGFVLVACATLPLAAWRRAPGAVFGATAGVSVVLAGLGYPLDLPLAPAVALYLLAASRRADDPWTGRMTGAVAGLFVAQLVAAGTAARTFPVFELLHNGLAWAAAWFAGERSRLRREQIAQLTERAQRAEREAARERRLAAAEERARIARDLHDSAGNAVSVIAVRAGAARLRHRQDPQHALQALAAIEELARQTGDEIDRIVGSLRQGDPPRPGVVEPPPGVASFGTLIDRHAATGLDVAFAARGRKRSLDSTSDQAAYRILQEALTNAARHGSGSARIELAYGDTAVELTVTNPVAASPASPAPDATAAHDPPDAPDAPPHPDSPAAPRAPDAVTTRQTPGEPDAATTRDAPPTPDATTTRDAPPTPDATTTRDAPRAPDATTTRDAPPTPDATTRDAPRAPDATTTRDAPRAPDAAPGAPDAPPQPDSPAAPRAPDASDAPPAPEASTAPRAGGGHGLIGMQERAVLLGGALQAERANGTFRVRATIPYGGRRP